MLFLCMPADLREIFMQKVLGVRFRDIGKIHYFLYSKKDDIKRGDLVIAETKRGVECGKVMVVCTDFQYDLQAPISDKIIRKANSHDLKSLESKKEEEKEAEIICKKKIAEHKLNMKLIDVEYMFDRRKVIFYFVSESRVDFRNLVRDLAHVFRMRIELRQVGIRDEAKILGGLGFCGKPLCCTTFLEDFQPVTIKMAKDQGMSLNPTKLSGTCGRLMCCLKYEEDVYRDILNKMPSVGSRVSTPEGNGTVVGGITIESKVKVSLDSDIESVIPKIFKINEIKEISES